MMALFLLFIPIIGLFNIIFFIKYINDYIFQKIGTFICILSLILCLGIFLIYDNNVIHFQFVKENYKLKGYNLYLGLDGLSIYFIILTAIIAPICIISNWISIKGSITVYVSIIIILKLVLLFVFFSLDIFIFYIFFETILPPLFILIGIFGSSNKIRASYYLFLYTLLGSLFLLLSILIINSIMGMTDYSNLFNINIEYIIQLFLFFGIFIAFCVKTPTIFLNIWLLKAHVESPLGGSIILAGVVLKLSLYGIMRLILPILPKAYIEFTNIIYVIVAVTIFYASFSTIRTIDIKELIAYSSVSHAAVYLMGVFSNVIQGIQGAIVLGLGHGFVSSALFICVGGVLYDRTSTRLITYYKGLTQLMPLFSILFFILCLSNAGTPLSLNFLGEFLSLYGSFERLSLLAIFACCSIVLSAIYTIYMYNRIAFGGKLSKYIKKNLPDLNKREFIILLFLTLFTIIFGIYSVPILEGLHYSSSTLIYYIDNSKDLMLYLSNPPKPHIFTGLPLQSNKAGLTYVFLIFLYIIYNYLTICLNNPPKPHLFVSLCLQSKTPEPSSPNTPCSPETPSSHTPTPSSPETPSSHTPSVEEPGTNSTIPSVLPTGGHDLDSVPKRIPPLYTGAIQPVFTDPTQTNTQPNIVYPLPVSWQHALERGSMFPPRFPNPGIAEVMPPERVEVIRDSLQQAGILPSPSQAQTSVQQNTTDCVNPTNSVNASSSNSSSVGPSVGISSTNNTPANTFGGNNTSVGISDVNNTSAGSSSRSSSISSSSSSSGETVRNNLHFENSNGNNNNNYIIKYNFEAIDEQGLMYKDNVLYSIAEKFAEIHSELAVFFLKIESSLFLFTYLISNFCLIYIYVYNIKHTGVYYFIKSYIYTYKKILLDIIKIIGFFFIIFILIGLTIYILYNFGANLLVLKEQIDFVLKHGYELLNYIYVTFYALLKNFFIMDVSSWLQDFKSQYFFSLLLEFKYQDSFSSLQDFKIEDFFSSLQDFNIEDFFSLVQYFFSYVLYSTTKQWLKGVLNDEPQPESPSLTTGGGGEGSGSGSRRPDRSPKQNNNNDGLKDKATEVLATMRNYPNTDRSRYYGRGLNLHNTFYNDPAFSRAVYSEIDRNERMRVARDFLSGSTSPRGQLHTFRHKNLTCLGKAIQKACENIIKK